MKSKETFDHRFWLPNPKEHNFPAALDYLELHYPTRQCKDVVSALRSAKTIMKKAKDILRASDLPLLPEENIHVQQNLRKMRGKKRKKLSPVLLVRTGGRLIIADGYHRVCAIYYLSEDLVIPCRLVSA